INVLKSKFEKVKQEKEGIEFKIKKFNNASKSLNKLIGSQITDNSKKGLGYYAVPPPHPLIYNGPTKLDLSYYGLDKFKEPEFKEPEFKGYGHRDSKLESNINHDKKSDDSKENSGDSFVKEQESEDTSSFVKSLLNVDKGTAFSVDKKDRINCTRHQRKRRVSRNNYNRVDYNYYAKTTHPSAQRNMTSRAVLLKIGLRPFNIVKPVYTAHPKQTVHSVKPMTHFSKQAQSTVQRPFYKQTTLTNRYFHQKANTARPKVVHTARPYIAQVNIVRAKRINAVKASTCWVWIPTRPNGASLVFKRHNYIDARGRSKLVMAWVITDNSKKGLGYYAVPPPHPLIYNGPTKLDLSYYGLDKFKEPEFKEPEFKGYGHRDIKLESNINHDKKSDDSKENSGDSFVKEQESEDTSSFVKSLLNVDKGTAFSVDKKDRVC
nr:hypothetical protein [Tanacetum cinerariifolium]